MEVELHRAALIVFAGLMVIAAFEDFRRLIIPNWLTLALALLWPIYLLAASSLTGALGAIGCALVVFAVGALCFARGYVGGGDVKLLTVATLWAGTAATAPLLVATGLLGGGLAMLLLMPPAAHMAELARARLGPGDAAASSGPAAIPYGIAIAGAAILVIVLPQFG